MPENPPPIDMPCPECGGHFVSDAKAPCTGTPPKPDLTEEGS